MAIVGDPINERVTSFYTTTLTDQDGVVIPAANLTTLTLTFYNRDSLAIINGRNAQPVLNINNVTIHATSGLLTWTMQPADNLIVDPTCAYEEHVLLFEWTLNNGNVGKHEASVLVKNLNKVS